MYLPSLPFMLFMPVVSKVHCCPNVCDVPDLRNLPDVSNVCPLCGSATDNRHPDQYVRESVSIISRVFVVSLLLKYINVFTKWMIIL